MGRCISFKEPVHTGCGSRANFLKRTGVEFEVKNLWRYKFIPPYTLMGWSLSVTGRSPVIFFMYF
jgi:hypothetical protein